MRTTVGASAALCFLVLLAACGGGTTRPASAAEGADTIAAARIHAMEDSLYARPNVDMKQAQALLDVYMLYAKTHPGDPLAPEYLFRGASIKVSLGDPQGAIGLYDRIIANFPSWGKLADTYYLKAFTIDNGLHRKGEAQQAYQEVIDRFPDHRLAADAKQSIANLQYTDEELIKRFEAMNADSMQAGASAGN
jgi:outer membrane protein assembly factor BamD (BamD/ComL family)